MISPRQKTNRDRRAKEPVAVCLLATTLATASVALAAALTPAAAQAPYAIDVVIPLTGGASFVGEGQRATLQALADDINSRGGIKGQKIAFNFHDDQTSPQNAVQATTAIVGAHPAIILGSSLAGMCLAMAPLMREGPTHYCLSPGIHPKPGGYTFSASTSSVDQIAAVVRYYRLKGWTKIAVLDTTDASGQDGDKSIDAVLAYPENKDVQKVAFEHFNPTDISVSAQIERIRASGAQAIIAWTTGGPAATVFKGMSQGGLDLPVAPTSGNQTFQAMQNWKGFLPKQLVLASALYPPHEGLIELDPRMEAAQKRLYAVMDAHHIKVDNQAATSWDVGLIVEAALNKLGTQATATQVRDFIANLKDFAGVDGIYDFTRYPERGLGPDASTVTTYDIQKDAWVWLSKPGGEPLK
jgi:branched-chain amino acid transport system substrate-binding protein